MISRGFGLITLACVLFIVTPANRVTTDSLPIASPAVSPIPVPTPEDDEEHPNAVRRFISWVKSGVTRPFRKRSTVIYDHFIIVSLQSSSSLITFCPTHTLIHCPTNREVKLVATATVPDGQGLIYAWMVTGGRLRDEGREVTWDLSGLAEGTYTATVEVNDGNYHTAAATTKVTVSLCDGCERPPKNELTLFAHNPMPELHKD